MRRFVLLLVLTLCILSGAAYSDSGDGKLIRVNLSGKDEAAVLELLRLHPDIASYNPKGRYVDIVASGSEVEAIQKLGFQTTVRIADLDARAKAMRQQDYFDHFHTYAEMLAEMQAVVAAHPNVAKLYDIGDSWEKTQGLADRDIWAIKISDNVSQQEADEPEVLYMACHHAREIITPDSETQAIRDLAEAHSFVIALSYHSYGNLLLFPWGYIEANTPDHPTFLGITQGMAAYNGYQPGNPASGTIYITNGDTDDWMYGEQTTKNKVFGITPEVGGVSRRISS
ncbi:MAG: M14 family zinc carboxypeptidase [bacterium]